MTITVGGSTPTGNYTITVTGTSGSTQETTTVTLTVTSSGGGGGGDSIIVYSTSGSPQTNRILSIGRFFKDGDIPNFAQAVIGSTPILTQCDVKNRWPDGSLKFAIVSFVIPNLSTSGTQVSFQNQSSGNNTGYLQQSDMLGQGYNFDGQMQLTGTNSPTISAHSILEAGDFTYWLQGPIVTAVILEDRNNELSTSTPMAEWAIRCIPSTRPGSIRRAIRWSWDLRLRIPGHRPRPTPRGTRRSRLR